MVHTVAYVAAYIVGRAHPDDVGRRPAGAAADRLDRALYIAHVRFSVPRFRDNTERFQNALTDLTSLFVDTYANIDTVKLFADQNHEDAESTARFRNTRETFISVQNMSRSSSIPAWCF